MKPAGIGARRAAWIFGLLILVGSVFFFQSAYVTSGFDWDDSGEFYIFSHAAVPPLLLGLGVAAAMWLTGLRGRERTVLEWIPTIAVCLALALLTGMPLLGGRYPAGDFYLPLLTYAILGIAVLDAVEAAAQRRILGFRPVVALVPALAALSTAVAPYLLDAFAAYRAEQTFSPGPGIPRPMLALYIAGLHALCLGSGAALLPFARPRSGAARWAWARRMCCCTRCSTSGRTRRASPGSRRALTGRGTSACRRGWCLSGFGPRARERAPELPAN